MKKNQINFLRNIVVILFVLLIVLYFSLKDDYVRIVTAIFNMHPIWIVLAVLLLVLYRTLISISHYLLIKQNKQYVPFLRCLQINFIILFFHGVTPFAGGGQPMEVYYLHQEGISIPKATNITLQNFITYQVALVVMGLFAMLYNLNFHLFPKDTLIKQLVILGFIINFVVLLVTYILSFGKRINKFILEKGIKFLSKIKIIKDEEVYEKKLKEYLTSFYSSAIELRKRRDLVLLYIIINILALGVLYSMPYVIALGLGIPITLIQTIVTTAYVMIIGSFVPIPGGTGGIEYSFVFFFGNFIKGSLVNAVMLLWRFASYYLGMILGAIALALYRKKEKNCE